MRFVLDSSAIFAALGPDTVERLFGKHTIELARYELGNIAWKEGVLHKRLTLAQQEKLVGLVSDVLGSMHTLSIVGHEKNITTLAVNLKVSFYDASYVYFAKILGAHFVTKDLKLASKVKDYVHLSDIGDL